MLLLLALLQAPAPTNPDGALIGTVYDADGRPYPGAQVVAQDVLRATLTDKTGRFQLLLPSGDHLVCIRSPGQIDLPAAIRTRSQVSLALTFRFPRPAGRSVLPSCRTDGPTLILAPTDTLLPVSNDEDRDELLWNAIAALHTGHFPTWAEAFYTVPAPDSARPAYPTYLLLPPQTPERSFWLQRAISGGLLTGVCHADAPAHCPGSALARYIVLTAPRLSGPDSAVVWARWAVTVPDACREGDNVPYWEVRTGLLFVRTSGRWRRAGLAEVWPEDLGDDRPAPDCPRPAAG